MGRSVRLPRQDESAVCWCPGRGTVSGSYGPRERRNRHTTSLVDTTVAAVHLLTWYNRIKTSRPSVDEAFESESMRYAPGKHPNSRNGFKTGHPAYFVDGVPPSRKGATHTAEAKAKMGVAQRERFEAQEHPSWKGGKPDCGECGKGLGRYGAILCKQHSNASRAGENHPRWKGGYENKLHHNRQRRATKKGATGEHTLAEWLALKIKYGFMCLCCKRTEPEITLSEDHIVPLSKGGSDNIENIQPLCRSCNSAKHAKIIDYVRA